jgi:retron-type reverse transcriptase
MSYQVFLPAPATACAGDLSVDGQPRSACFGKHTKRFRERGVGFYPKAALTFMSTKHKNLFQQITDPDNLWEAYRKASLGKRNTLGYLRFRSDEGANLVLLRQALLDGSYRPGKPRVFNVYEPKKREISALPFVDRVAQHALCNIIEPIFDKVFLPQSYACRTGKGTHQAAITVQAMLRRVISAGGDPWILKTDFSKYFASIGRTLLHAEYRKKISCKPTLALLEQFVPAQGVGLLIGHLVSQLSANLFGHIFDRWFVHQIGLCQFARYMDDVVVVGHSREAMVLLQAQAQAFAQDHMGLKFSHWSVQHWQRGVNFCGYRIWPTHKLLRRSSVTRAKKKLANFEKTGDVDARLKFLASWQGHAKWADCRNLLTHLGATS